MHYLLDVFVRMKKLGIDPAVVPGPHGSMTSANAAPGAAATACHGCGGDESCGSRKRKAVVPPPVTGAGAGAGAGAVKPAASRSPRAPVVLLDIDGTTTPTSFVKEVLLPAFSKDVRLADVCVVVCGCVWLCGCVAVAVAVCPFLHLICCFTCLLSYQATLPQQIGIRRRSVSCSAKRRRRLLLCVATRPSGTLWKRMFSTASQPNSTLRRPPKPAHASCNMWRAAHRFTPAVKTLQGLVWEGGYRSGSIKGALFDDVPAALKALHAQGARVYLFSSGSSLAQALVFKHSKHGDLSAYISGYIDTTLGWVLLRARVMAMVCR